MEKYAIVIAGLSGAGKTTVAERLISSLGNIEMSRSATTRERRGDGKDDEYIYLSKEEFLAAIESGDILEYADYNGNLYGTRRAELERIWDSGRNPILVLEFNGVRAMKERLDVPAYAFYVYTTLEEAERRLVKRDMESAPSEKKADTLRKRISRNVSDFKELPSISCLFDSYVNNAELEDAVDSVRRALLTLGEGGEVMSVSEKESLTARFAAEAAERNP